MDMYEVIETILLEKGLNKKKLAEKIKVPYPSVISAFQRHSKSFSVKHQDKILEALNISIGEYCDRLYGEDFVKQLANDVKLLQSISNKYGKEAVELLDLFSKLNPTGAEKALVYIADLTKIDEYRKSE